VHGELKVLSALLDAGFPLNCTSGPQKISPLKAFAMGNRAARPSWAAMGLPLDPGVKEPVAMMQLFVHHGADLNIKDVWGGSPLRATAEKNNVDLAALLLQAGADVNNYIDDSTSIGEQRGNTVLMEAVFWYSLRWDPTLVRLLLHHRADVDFRNDLRYDEECDKMTSGKCTFRGQTALTRAATDGLYAIARALLDGGANPTLSRGDGAAPAEIARANGHARTSELIEKHVKRSSASP
jgi:ankyrin repeat protein